MLIAIAVLIIIGIMVSNDDFKDFIWAMIAGLFSVAAWLLVMLVRGLIVVVPVVIGVWMIFLGNSIIFRKIICR